MQEIRSVFEKKALNPQISDCPNFPLTLMACLLNVCRLFGGLLDSAVESEAHIRSSSQNQLQLLSVVKAGIGGKSTSSA